MVRRVLRYFGVVVAVSRISPWPCTRDTRTVRSTPAIAYRVTTAVLRGKARFDVGPESRGDPARSRMTAHASRERSGSPPCRLRGRSAAVRFLCNWLGIMQSSRRYSTCTVRDDGRIVPWLAASGPLSYTPESPPPSNYYFQYSWVLPGIFDPSTNTRRHFYFGAHYKKEDAKELFSFWNAARQGRTMPVARHFGGVGADARISAPMAIYSALDLGGRAGYLFMQHGSYQLVSTANQPRLPAGEVVLYRGIGRSRVFRFLRVDHSRGNSAWRLLWQNYIRAQSRMLSDSVLSFNSIHDRARRCETGHIRDGTWISDEIARNEGLDATNDPLATALWKATHQSFSLAQWVGERKFGPHFVTGRTPIGNIRLTTFFAGEHEVRIIDPDLVEFVDSRGCQVERPALSSSTRRSERRRSLWTPATDEVLGRNH